MKKVIRMISLVLLGIWGIVGMSEAQTTCSAPPSCSALGFDKGAGDCSGQAILRCPFDQSKVFCAGVLPGSGDGGTCKGNCARINGTMYRLSEIVAFDMTWEEQARLCADLTTDDKYWIPIPSAEIAQTFMERIKNETGCPTCLNFKNVAGDGAAIDDQGEVVYLIDNGISYFSCDIYCVTTY